MSVTDPNIQRGQVHYFSTINAEKPHMDAPSTARLNKLQEHFEDKIGVMPSDGLYAAKRMAQACLKAALIDVSFDEGVEIALTFYADSGSSAIRGSAPTFRLSNNSEIKNRGTSIEGYADSGDQEHDTVTRELADIINVASEIKTTEEFLVEDEDGEIRTFDAEVIDLLDDAASEGQLSVEGMRSIGLIRPDFDTTKDVLDSDIITSANDLVSKDEENWRTDDDGHLIILCPTCRGEKIYPLGENMFGCFDCDTEFQFRHNLGDFA